MKRQELIYREKGGGKEEESDKCSKRMKNEVKCVLIIEPFYLLNEIKEAKRNKRDRHQRREGK